VITTLLVMLRLSMGRAVPLSPLVPAWHVAGQPLANVFQWCMSLKKYSGKKWRWFQKSWYVYLYTFTTLLYVEYTVVGLVRSQQAGWSGCDSWQGWEIFSFLRQASPAPGPIQSTVYWVFGMLSMGGQSGWDRKPTSQPNLVQELIMSGTIPLPPTTPILPLWLAHVQPYWLFHLMTYHFKICRVANEMVICVMHWRVGRELSWPL
jgi:hypothetical protein